LPFYPTFAGFGHIFNKCFVSCTNIDEKKDMKIRGREHEAVLVSIIAAIIISQYLLEMLRLSPQQIETEYAAGFINAHTSFNYYTRVLFPQIGTILVLLLSYFWINRFVVRPLSVPGEKKISTFLLAILQVIIITYLIGPVMYFASFYINPYYGSHSGLIQLPLIFGSHPQPFKNLFGGWSASIFCVVIYLLYAFLRELVIKYFEKADSRKPYRILIINQVSIFLVIFFAAPAFTSIFNLDIDRFYYNVYFTFIPTVEAVFITNIYWLFPSKCTGGLFTWRFVGTLLFSTFVYAGFFSISFGQYFTLWLVLSNWAVQVLVITPISWLDYQQRKDKILQLRGAEKALVKSKADLQFLRSQINPHFLFNALNTLYGTALLEGSKNAAAGIQQLGDMMRFMLHENTMDFIDMSKEIEYLKNYISLQKLRTQASPDILIEDNITDEGCNYKIAPMLLIPFVENAFKHGIRLTGKSWIKIKLDCEEGMINFEVCNSVHPVNTNDPEIERSGIGLINVQERLLLLYPEKHQFVHGVAGDEFIARLSIQP
jgi:two-component system LytT family sensor kinase